MFDISSAESMREAYAAAAAPAVKVSRKRKAQEQPRLPSSSSSSVVPQPPIRFDQEVVRRAIAQSPRIELMTTLLHEHPHTDANSTCELATQKLVAHAVANTASVGRSKTSSAAKESEVPQLLRALLRAPLHQTGQVPGMAEFWRLRARLSVPAFRIPGQTLLPSATEAAHHLRMDAASLVCYTAQHESQLLLQAGTFDFPQQQLRRTFPPCRNGQQCVAHTHPANFDGLAGPIVLMRAMSPEQLRRLFQTGQAPAGASPCVLCHRESLSEYVHFMRAMTAQPHPQLRLDHEQAGEVTQLWCNPVQCATGYFHEYTLFPVGQQEVTVAPVCEVHGWGITARRSQENGQWQLDQTQLVWRERLALEPRIGERLRNF